MELYKYKQNSSVITNGIIQINMVYSIANLF